MTNLLFRGDYNDYLFDESKLAKLEGVIINAVTLNMTNEINKQNSAFSKMVHDHAIGVQRVYDEMQKLVTRVVKLENYEGDDNEKEEEEIDLRACPFCSSSAELSDFGFADYAVQCSGCDVKTAIHDTAYSAAEAWNWRA